MIECNRYNPNAGYFICRCCRNNFTIYQKFEDLKFIDKYRCPHCLAIDCECGATNRHLMRFECSLDAEEIDTDI